MELDIRHFKDKLGVELAKLEGELSTVAHRNPDNQDEWIAKKDDLETAPADKNEVADSFESLEENAAILRELGVRYDNVKLALGKIEAGTYGVCEIVEKPIELDRLEANPAARTCKEHINETPE